MLEGKKVNKNTLNRGQNLWLGWPGVLVDARADRCEEMGNMQMPGALADVRAGWSWLCREHWDVVRGFSPGFPSSSSHLWSSGLITPMSLSCASVRFHCWPFMPFSSLMVLVCLKQGSLMFFFSTMVRQFTIFCYHYTK